MDVRDDIMLIDRKLRRCITERAGKDVVARQLILPKVNFESISNRRSQTSTLTSPEIACYVFSCF